MTCTDVVLGRNKALASRAEARIKIATWIADFYTTQRRHSAGGGLAPITFEQQSQARAARAALLEQLTRPHHFVAGAHLDSPGIARVTPSGDGYALEYLAPPIG
ncbi:hypothetical protein ACQPZP_04510 [Spirillospora sp. CA-142024]|uniref:hypothetical protein n=1 Tax=Spirillospora sp. CA-142024 TaxID=3240036 RepID=UPI003D8FB46E